MSTDTQYLTSEKFAELKKELEFLKTDRPFYGKRASPAGEGWG